MRRTTAIFGFALLMLAGCGDLGLGDYKLETGTYNVRSATLAAGGDSCNLLRFYEDAANKQIGITTSAETVTFNLPNDPTLDTFKQPTATLTSNTLTKDAEADWDQDWDGQCVTHIVNFVEGDVTADNTAQLTLTYNATRVAGTCDSVTTPFAIVPCSANLNFTATKQ